MISKLMIAAAHDSKFCEEGSLVPSGVRPPSIDREIDEAAFKRGRSRIVTAVGDVWTERKKNPETGEYLSCKEKMELTMETLRECLGEDFC